MVATHVAWTETERSLVFLPAERDPGDYVGLHRTGFPRWSLDMTRLNIYIRDDKAVTDSEHYCRSWRCDDTNWQGHGRLHQRSSECPPYRRQEVQTPDLHQYELEDRMAVKNAAYYARMRAEREAESTTTHRRES